MRTTPVVATIPLLLLLLTWLSFRALNADAELFDHALGALDRFTMVESALQRDVLSARAGVLRNYDPLVRETNDLDASLLKLRETAAVDAETSAALDRLARSIAGQETLVEQFKSSNALLQNSLAYFGLYSARLGGSEHGGPIAPIASSLAVAMLRLTLDTSAVTARAVETRLDELARQPSPPGQAASIQALLAHGRLLHELLPATDAVLKALRAVPQKQDRGALRTMILRRQGASRATARRFRLLLYVTSLLLVALLIYLGQQLRARAGALHRRAAFEHAIAGISTRFINARTDVLGRHVEHALAEMAAHVGADRAYFIPGGRSVRRHVWSREGVVFPPFWPDRAAQLASRFAPTAEGIIHISCVDRLPPGEDRDTLVSSGLRGWVCVPGLDDKGNVILGFDAMRRRQIWQPQELGLLRMALDAVANAVRRDALEQEAARLEQRLQQSRRMEAVGTLTSGIAHNFNNIIAAILGYAEIAEARLASDSGPAGDIIEIRRAGERARDLVDQMLAFGRRRDSHREPLTVRDLVDEAASLLRVSLPSGIELAIDDAAGSAVISAEHGQLQQVILNLCNNAAQAMDGRGNVVIETIIHEYTQPRPLSHGTLPPGRYLCIAVLDFGRGMDAAVLGHVFEPFFTTRLGGTGLGLATVYEIVREHGGTMQVSSAPRAGTRFEAWLPCPATDVSAPAQASQLLPFGRGETVLVVDEEREQVLRDEEILAALGYEPAGFTQPDDALMACRQALYRFDILVVGQLAPGPSTLEFAAELHRIAPNLPIVLAAARDNEFDVDALVAAGVADVVHWPIIAAEIAAALAGCLETRMKAEQRSSCREA